MKDLIHILGLLVATVCLANVIRVPEDYVDLQAAVNSAVLGDTVSFSDTVVHNYSGTNLFRSISFTSHDTDGIDVSPTIIISSDLFRINNLTSNSKIKISDLNFVSSYLADIISPDVPVPTYSLVLDNISYGGSSSSVIADWTCDSIRVNNCFFSNCNPELRSHYIEVTATKFRNCSISVGSDHSHGIIDRSSFTGSSLNLNGNLLMDRSTFIGQSYYGIVMSGSIVVSNSIVVPYNFQTYAITIDNVPSGSSLNLSYSDVLNLSTSILNPGNASVLITNSMSEDPQMDVEYKLTQTSPCIDAGDPSSPLDPDGTRADIGAYYFCQGEGIRLPDVIRTSAEPGHPEQLTATLQSSCDAVQIDSARTTTGLFTLNSYPSQIAQDYSTGSFHLTFNPTQQGLYADTLHIWANTVPSHHMVPLVGEAGPIPAPVADLSISILPDLSAQLTWSPVTDTIYGNPVVPDYYLIYYSELPPNQDTFFYLSSEQDPGYIHPRVARFAPRMYYRIVAYKGINPATLGIEPGMAWPEVQQRLAGEDR